jgi:ethanolamine utilization protein EutN
MLIARVTGTVVATRKHDRLVGSTIQIVQPLAADGRTPLGDAFIAVDAVGAGVDERVVVVTGSGARLAIDDDRAPVDATIVGIIDQVNIEGDS